MKKAALVYQAGIANVFEVSQFDNDVKKRDAKRLLQSSFILAAHFAMGLERAGVQVKTLACNMAGDIVNQPWSCNLEEQPFSDKFIIVG